MGRSCGSGQERTVRAALGGTVHSEQNRVQRRCRRSLLRVPSGQALGCNTFDCATWQDSYFIPIAAQGPANSMLDKLIQVINNNWKRFLQFYQHLMMWIKEIVKVS